MKFNTRGTRRLLHRLLNTIFVLMLFLPPELPILFPARVMAAGLDNGPEAETEGIRADDLLDVTSGSGVVSEESAIDAVNPTIMTPQRQGNDLAPAYIDTIDLGNGERGAVISADPIKYLSTEGEWKEIDPRFTAQVDGFSNLTNIMTVKAGARQPVLDVSHNGLDARWTPFSLVLADGGREMVLAKPRPTQAVEGILSTDGRTVSYPGSWTMVGMEDEIVAGAGEAEHNVLFAQPPALNGELPSVDAKLVLRARLELPPGGQLWSGGTQQTSAFSTTNTIELRNHEWTASLNLNPALIFEKERPDETLLATYHVTPINLRSWEISMETPLSWWVDPARQYPVVWDPLMQVLRAIDVAQIYQNPACTAFLTESTAVSGVGRATCYIGNTPYYSPVRTLLRFNQIADMNLPPQAEIQGAILLVAPYWGLVNHTSYGEFHPCVNTRLHQVTSAWSPATTNWQNQPSIGQAFLSNSTSYAGRNDPPLCWRPEPYSSTNSGTKYLLQNGPNGIVTDWINGGSNLGLELRATEAEENGCDHRFGCDYVEMPKRSQWPRIDRDKLFDNDFEATEGSGFMLVVRYKAPTLVDNVPFKYDFPTPEPPKFEDENFHRTRHSYLLPARPNTNPEWLAVGVKGFRTSVNYFGEEKVGLFSHATWSQLGSKFTLDGASVGGESDGVEVNAINATNLTAYAFPIAVVPENCVPANCQVRSEGNGSTDGSNFILVNANSALGRELRIDPLAADPNLKVYAAEASWSKNMPAVNAAQVGETGVRFNYTTTLDSTHIVQALNLSLPENVRVGISTTVVYSDSDNEDLSAPVITHFFRPGGGIYPKSAKHDQTKSNSVESLQLRTLVPPGQGGNHAIVLELPGDKTAFQACSGEGCSGVPDEQPKDRAMQVVIQVQVCPANSIPTDQGCALIVWPTYDNPDLWREVPPYRIFSPAGFVACGVGYECSKRFANNKEYATVVTWGTETKRAGIFAGDGLFDGLTLVEFRNHATLTQRSLRSFGIFALGKSDNGSAVSTFFEIADGVSTEALYSVNRPGILQRYCFDGCHALALDGYDQANLFERDLDVPFNSPIIYVSMEQNASDTISQYAEFETEVMRTLDTISGPQNQLLDLKWRVQAEGYRGWAESPGGTGPLNVVATAANQIASAPVAGLTYQYNYLGGTPWEAHYNEETGFFAEFRNNNGRIVQPASLGGAWNYVDYVVLPFGKSPSGGSGLAMCPGFCGDVRAPDDTFVNPNRQWKLPDILVNQLPNTVMVSSPGNLQVYSSDHPSSIGATNDTYGMSFKTFGAKVELTDGVCPGGASNQPVSLIKGTTSLSMPGLDAKADPQADTSAIPSITASFVLCENVLRQVEITFKYPPGIPVAAPPVMYVDMIGGTVTIGPENVVISVAVGFYVGAGAPKVMKGTATLTLDTRGLFQLQVEARVLGTLDADGRIWVAWNPIDMGVGVKAWLPNKKDWVISGFAYAHVWRGAGWQNKYPWLAGNDDFHFTASLQAEFKIAKGAVIDEWPLIIPPGEIRIGVELSFGQFCDNDGCTKYIWGIKGKVTIAGFDVGIFVDLDCPPLLAAVVFPPMVLLCSSFILGSDDHLLIDQYGGGGPPFPQGAGGASTVMEAEATRKDARLASAKRIQVADPYAAAVDQALPVSESASSMMVAFGWVRGNPDFALVKPGGEVITEANAVSMGAVVTTTPNSIIFGIQNPTPGQWIARVTNATVNDDYRIMYFANKATPNLTFTAPAGLVQVNATGNSTSAQSYKIQWTPPANAAQLSMSLYYSATVLNPTSPDYQYGGVIRENIDPSTGAFDWDLSYLSSGDYRVYATLQDKKGAQVSEFGTDQYVGISTSIAPGTLRYSDLVGPPQPNVAAITFASVEDGALVCWPVSAAHDLSEYLITYTIFDVLYPLGRTLTERVVASVPFAPNARQCLRIGGLVPGESVLDFIFINHGVAAVDASGNISGFAAPTAYSPVANGAKLNGPPPLVLSGTSSNGNANLSWGDGAVALAASRYELFYAREAFAGPHQAGTGAAQGASPISINAASFTGNFTVGGLPRGFWYAFAVRQIDADPTMPPSLLSNQVWLLITNGVDSNGDGCPDDWEAAHQPYDGSSNPDGDGLTTAQECQVGTNPNLPDSDGDGTIDGVEVAEGSDPRNPLSVPTLTPAEANAGFEPPLPAILAVEAVNLSFFAFTQGANPEPQSVPYSNLGDGSFTLNLTDNQPWLSATVVDGTIEVNIDKAGLERGTYNGVVQVSANPASTIGSPQTINVQLVMVAGVSPTALEPGEQPNQPSGPVYLPRVGK